MFVCAFVSTRRNRNTERHILKKKSKSKFSFSIWDGVVGDEGGPEDGPGLDDPGAVGLDLGEVFLELQTAASGQSGNGTGI